MRSARWRAINTRSHPAAGAGPGSSARRLAGSIRQHAAQRQRRGQRRHQALRWPAGCRCPNRPQLAAVERPLRHRVVDRGRCRQAGHPAGRCSSAGAAVIDLARKTAAGKVKRRWPPISGEQRTGQVAATSRSRPRIRCSRCDAAACSFSPAVSWPTTSATTSITAKVTRYCTSLTANESVAAR